MLEALARLAQEETNAIRLFTTLQEVLEKLERRRTWRDERERLVTERLRLATTVSRLENEREELRVDTNEGLKCGRFASSADEQTGRKLDELKRRREELERSKSERHELEEKIEVALASSESIIIVRAFSSSH